MLRKSLYFTLILSIALFAAKKERDWKTARVLDSNSDLSSYVTGSTTNTSGTATTTGSASTSTMVTGNTANSSTTMGANTTTNSTSNTTIHRVTVQQNQLLLAGEGYFYVIHDERMRSGPLLTKAIVNRHHGCRFVVGEDVKYSQDKADLYVVDADGKACKVPILRQEKR